MRTSPARRSAATAIRPSPSARSSTASAATSAGGRRHALPAGTLSLMNPEEPHTGHAESERLVYRMLYVEETRLLGLLGRKQLPRGFGELNPADDGSVAAGLAWLAEDFQRSDALGLESRLLALLEQVFVRHGGLRPAARRPATAEPPHACAITWKRMLPRRSVWTSWRSCCSATRAT